MLQLQELNCLLDFLKNHWLHVNMPDIFPLLLQLLLFLLHARSEVRLGLPPAPSKSRGECVPPDNQVSWLSVLDCWNSIRWIWNWWCNPPQKVLLPSPPSFNMIASLLSKGGRDLSSTPPFLRRPKTTPPTSRSTPCFPVVGFAGLDPSQALLLNIISHKVHRIPKP